MATPSTIAPATWLSEFQKAGYSISQIVTLLNSLGLGEFANYLGLNQQQEPAKTGDVVEKPSIIPPGPMAPGVGDIPLGDKIIPPGPMAPATTPAESPFKQVHVPIPDEKGNFYTQVTNPNYYAPGVGNLYSNDAEAALAGKYPDLWTQYLAALKQGEKLPFGEWTQNQLMPKIGLSGLI